MTIDMPELTPRARRLLQAIADQQDKGGAYFNRAEGGALRMGGSDLTASKAMLRRLSEQGFIFLHGDLTEAAVTYSGVRWLAAHSKTRPRRLRTEADLEAGADYFEAHCQCRDRMMKAEDLTTDLLAQAGAGAHRLTLYLGGDTVRLRTAGPRFRYPLLEPGSIDFLALLGQAVIHGGDGGLVLRTIRPGMCDRVQGWRFSDRFTPLTETEIAEFFAPPLGEDRGQEADENEYCTAFSLAANEPQRCDLGAPSGARNRPSQTEETGPR